MVVGGSVLRGGWEVLCVGDVGGWGGVGGWGSSGVGNGGCGAVISWGWEVLCVWGSNGSGEVVIRGG